MDKSNKLNREMILQDLADIVDQKEIRNAVTLNDKLKNDFAIKTEPMYFTGKPSADTVFVMLNPGSPNDIFPEKDIISKYEDESTRFKNYTEKWSNYGLNSNKIDNFDLKQAAFIHSFKAPGISIPEKFWLKSEQDKLVAQRNVLTQKFQLELIPYGSRKFSDQFKTLTSTKNKINVIMPYIVGILDAINASNRKYIIFGSKQFYNIFKVLKREKLMDIELGIEYRSNLDGHINFKTTCSTVVINHKDHIIKACIAHTFPSQALPNAYEKMAMYGEFCFNQYKEIL